jgi:hypothetical protein
MALQEILSSDAAIALYGAIVGGSLTIVYDVKKTRRQDKRRDRMVLNLLHTQIDDILSITAEIKRLLEAERDMPGDQLLPEPVPPLPGDVLDVLRLGIPDLFYRDKALFQDVRQTHHLAAVVAGILDAREAWRRDKALMSGVRARIVEYDVLALRRIEELQAVASRALNSLEAHANAS